MNGTYPARWVAPLKRRSGWRLPLALWVMLGAVAACGSGDSGEDGEVGTRLTTMNAEDLLSSDGFTPAGPRSRGLEALSRVPPYRPTPEEMSLDSLGVDYGTSDAPVRIMEFYDYGCGYCRQFHQETRDPLHEQYVDQGQVFWKSIPFIIGRWPASVPVSLAAECARDQGRESFETISDLLFQNQSEWKSASAPEEVAAMFAEEAGLDMTRYRSCIESDELLWRVQAQTALADQLGVRGTPTFFIVGWGTIPGALPLETFRQVIDTVLVEAAAGQL